MQRENPLQQCKNCGEEHRNLYTNLCTECAAQLEQAKIWKLWELDKKLDEFVATGSLKNAQ